jgi:microcystin-dependent protein
MSCTAADLINIQPLVLSDTFNTWFDRTNEIIEAASAINVFDVAVGPTNGGLIKETGCSGGYYNGVVTISVNPGAGIGIGTPAFTNNYNKVVIDAIRLEDLGTGSSANPAQNDYAIFSDLSDTRQGAAGTPKRTTARRMLPNEVEFGETGNGTFTINGNVNIVGNLVVVGDDVTYIDSNDLRIEDRLIELAYTRFSQFTVAGTSLTGTSFASGLTFFYHDSVIPSIGANATTIGTVANWSVAPSGTTGTIRIGAFSEGGVDDIAVGGRIVITGAVYTSALVVTGGITNGTDFYTDTLLQPAGLDIKGSQGDKYFVWWKSSPEGGEDWNGFFSNTNLGVTGSNNYIVSSKFSSYGYGAGTDDTYTYYGSGNSFTKYQVGEQLSMFHSATGAAGITFGIVYSGSTGPAVYPNVPVTNWVKFFNADQLDGAHALTTATPWSIPVSLADGRLHEDWIRADAIRKRFCQTGHAFSIGHVLRFDVDGSLTFAQANTVPNAEAIGMVESVDGNCFSLVTKGFIRGLTNGGGLTGLYPLATGQAYYLHPDLGGRLISNPDGGAYEVQAGEVRKAVFLATGYNSGYVINYTGVVVGDTPTDLVYLRSAAPIGSVHPFAGAIDAIPDGWLLCDGAVKSQNEWNDLYTAINQNHYAGGAVYNANTIVIDGDTRGLTAGDAVRVVWATGEATVLVGSSNTANRRVQLTTTPFTDVPEDTELKIYGRSVGSSVGNSVFFLPDLRRRSVFGVSTATGLAGSGIITPQIGLGTVGGESEITLLANNIPPHNHTLNTLVGNEPTTSKRGSSTNETGGLVGTGETPTPFDNLPPYVTMHWIIRSNKGFQATILTGHNHDNHYIRYNIAHTVAAGAARTLTEADRTQFRANAKVLRNDADDTFRGTLTVTGGVSILGVNNSSIDLSVAGGMSADYSEVNRSYVKDFLNVTNTATAYDFVGFGTIPLGGIIMWSGTTIPTGWALCDGRTQNSRLTPDLRGRFIMGVNTTQFSSTVDTQWGTNNVNDKGGTASIGAHRHSIDFISRDRVELFSDATVQIGVWGSGGAGGNQPLNPASFPPANAPTTLEQQNPGGDNSGDRYRTHTSGVTMAAASSLPPYYALAFIMRTL